MPGSTKVIELAVPKRLAKEGRRLFEAMHEAELSVYRNVNLANYRAWELGRFLVCAKEEIGHGLFLAWREETFPKVKMRKAYKCQELYLKNPNVSVLTHFDEGSLTRFAESLNPDSIRKYRLGYVPEKEHPELPGNVKFQRPDDFGGVINEFNKWRRRREVGHVQKDLAAERQGFHDMYDWLGQELYSTA